MRNPRLIRPCAFTLIRCAYVTAMKHLHATIKTHLHANHFEHTHPNNHIAISPLSDLTKDHKARIIKKRFEPNCISFKDSRGVRVARRHRMICTAWVR